MKTLVALAICLVPVAAMAVDKIEVQKATYGVVSTLIDVTDGVKALCEGKTSCSFRVLPEPLGVSDPIVGTTKRLIVTWSCGDKGMPTVEKRDDQVVDMSCKKLGR